MSGRLLREAGRFLSNVYQVPHQLTCITHCFPHRTLFPWLLNNLPAEKLGCFCFLVPEALGSLENILRSRNTNIFQLWEHSSVSESKNYGILLVNEMTRSCLSHWLRMMIFTKTLFLHVRVSRSTPLYLRNLHDLLQLSQPLRHLFI